jgi:hypothetical protein
MTTTVETVAEFRRSQVIVVEWMENALAGLADTDLVSVTRNDCGFMGRFVMHVEVAR